MSDKEDKKGFFVVFWIFKTGKQNLSQSFLEKDYLMINKWNTMHSEGFTRPEKRENQ